MTFKDEIDAAGERYWKSAYEDRVTDVLDACVEKIDELERDLDNVRAATCHLDDRVLSIERRLPIENRIGRDADGDDHE